MPVTDPIIDSAKKPLLLYPHTNHPRLTFRGFGRRLTVPVLRSLPATALFRQVGNYLILDQRTEGPLPHYHRYAPSFFPCPLALCTDTREEAAGFEPATLLDEAAMALEGR